MEWLLPHQLRHVATADALGTDEFGCISPTGQGHPQALQVRFEFSSGNSGNFCTNAAKVFLLTTNGHGIPHREPFSADFTATRHHTTFFL